MKAIHGGKSKNDRIDSEKIAAMLRGGMFPVAYVYPKEMRATRDLLRRREYFVRHQAELFTHIEHTKAQKNIKADMSLANAFHRLILDLEQEIQRQAKTHDPFSLALLRTIPGIGEILSLVFLYEIEDIHRFPDVGNFISYCRLVKCAHESAGKRVKGGNDKIGNTHLKWVYSEASVLFLRNNEPAQKLHDKLVKKYGKAKALSIIAQKLARTSYYMLKRKEPFDETRFFQDSVSEHPA
jgi:transposase